MQELYRIKPLKMLAWWVACSFFIFPLTIIVFSLLALPLFFVLGTIFSDISGTAITVLSLLAIPCIGALVGACIAFLQRWILRTKLYWAADRWYLWTSIGGAIGAIVVGFSNGFSIFYGDFTYMWMLPIFLAVVSAFQFISLRHAVKQAWLWIIANVIGAVVFAGILNNNQPSFTNPNHALISIAVAFFAVAAMGFITGFVLLFLFEHKLLPMRPDTDDEVLENQPKSVWDRAI